MGKKKKKKFKVILARDCGVTLPSSGHLHCRWQLFSWPCWCWRDWIIISHMIRTHFHISLDNKSLWGRNHALSIFSPGGNDPQGSKISTCNFIVSPPTPADSANLRPNRSVVCVYWRKKKNPCISGPSQLKPMLFKGQLHLLTLMWNMFSSHPAEDIRMLHFSPFLLLPTLESTSAQAA